MRNFLQQTPPFLINLPSPLPPHCVWSLSPLYSNFFKFSPFPFPILSLFQLFTPPLETSLLQKSVFVIFPPHSLVTPASSITPNPVSENFVSDIWCVFQIPYFGITTLHRYFYLGVRALPRYLICQPFTSTPLPNDFPQLAQHLVACAQNITLKKPSLISTSTH